MDGLQGDRAAGPCWPSTDANRRSAARTDRPGWRACWCRDVRPPVRHRSRHVADLPARLPGPGPDDPVDDASRRGRPEPAAHPRRGGVAGKPDALRPGELSDQPTRAGRGRGDGLGTRFRRVAGGATRPARRRRPSGDVHCRPSGAAPGDPGRSRLPRAADRPGGRGAGPGGPGAEGHRPGRVRRLAAAAAVVRDTGSRPRSGRDAGAAGRSDLVGDPDLGLAPGRRRSEAATGAALGAPDRRQAPDAGRHRRPERLPGPLPGDALGAGDRCVDGRRGRFQGARRRRRPTAGRLPPAGNGRIRRWSAASWPTTRSSRSSSRTGRTGTAWSGCWNCHRRCASRGSDRGSADSTTGAVRAGSASSGGSVNPILACNFRSGAGAQ